MNGNRDFSLCDDLEDDEVRGLWVSLLGLSSFFLDIIGFSVHRRGDKS